VIGGQALSGAEEIAPESRRQLLKVARDALASHLAGDRLELPAATGVLGEPHGAFVTLRVRAGGELRGCVGVLSSDEPLVKAVARMAVAAGTQDGRFAPVSAHELPQLTLEISVLGPLREIRPEEVEVGRHGLLASEGHRRGVLLPQVPVEHGWDRERFLAHTCLKAGLSPDAWRRPTVVLRGFTATVFGEEDAAAPA
jgi:AmmeMemoRadiSam system protein A